MSTLAKLHRTASRIRNSSFLARQQWLWARIQPLWDKVLSKSENGMPCRINGESCHLIYEYAARFDKSGQYEPLISAALMDEIHEGDVVFDIGAHIGIISLLAARKARHVVAFEPSPETAQILRRHVAMNGAPIAVEQSVVSDSVGSVEFYSHGPSMGASLNIDNAEQAARLEGGDQHISVVKMPSVTLDAFCRARELWPDVIKIDVEGAECKVLRGAHAVLQRGVTILCEVHPQELARMGDSETAVRQLIADFGYSWRQIDQPSNTGIYHAVLKPRFTRN